MPTNLLLLPLLGGYWFLHTFYYTRFRSQRLDGYRLLVESAFTGVLLSCAAWLLLLFIRKSTWSYALWKQVAPEMPFLGTACGSLALGVLLPHVLNLMCSRVNAQLRAIEKHGNQLLQLLHAASAEERLVSVTLDNRKVYIGAIAGAPNLEPHDVFVSITPFFSGYRDKDTLGLILGVSYLEVYERENLDPKDFTVTVPLDSIRIASFFDHKAYPAFLVASSQSDPDTAGLEHDGPQAGASPA